MIAIFNKITKLYLNCSHPRLTPIIFLTMYDNIPSSFYGGLTKQRIGYKYVYPLPLFKNIRRPCICIL